MQILIIQTAFIGDVVLATPVLEKLRQYFPDSEIDFLIRKGNENLLEGNPNVRSVLLWDKGRHKRRNLLKLAGTVRTNRYDLIVNLHRHFSTGLVTWLAGAGQTIGFKENPLSFGYDEAYEHSIGDGTHEVERNLKLIADITDDEIERPKLYLSDAIKEQVRWLKDQSYLTIAPTSLWSTKRFPQGKWIEFIRKVRFTGNIYLIGSQQDFEWCERIAERSDNVRVKNLCGKLTLLESAALMEDARMNYVNDSAPLHLASAVNAPVCAVFCSTVPAFGFGPLSDKSFIVELEEELYCRPCGVHGYTRCPEEHFRCAKNIDVQKLVEVLEEVSEKI